MGNRPLLCPYYPCETHLSSLPNDDTTICARCHRTIFVRQYQGAPWLLTEPQVAAWDGRWDITSPGRPDHLRRFSRVGRLTPHPR